MTRASALFVAAAATEWFPRAAWQARIRRVALGPLTPVVDALCLRGEDRLCKGDFSLTLVTAAEVD